MGLFHTSDAEIADEVARLRAARDLDGLARKLAAPDRRWREAAAAALAGHGAGAASAAVSATLPLATTGDDAARDGVSALFSRLGPGVASVVTDDVLSIDTQLAADVPARLHYFEGLAAAMGAGAQGAVAPLLERDGPWPAIAARALGVRSTRTATLLVSPETVGRVTLGRQTIALPEAEEAIRATARQWAATCLLDLVARGDALDEGPLTALESAVVDGVKPACRLDDSGLPLLEPLEIMHRHERGEKNVLERLQADVLAWRYEPADHAPEERRDLEDLFIATLALGVLRKYAYHGAGVSLAPDEVRARFTRLIDGDEAAAGGAVGAGVAMNRLAGLRLCCSMHLRRPEEQLIAAPPLDALIPALARCAASGAVDHALTRQTLIRLRRDRS
jgi:hypothetical protein